MSDPSLGGGLNVLTDFFFTRSGTTLTKVALEVLFFTAFSQADVSQFLAAFERTELPQT
jgi:hypothetical protein